MNFFFAASLNVKHNSVFIFLCLFSTILLVNTFCKNKKELTYKENFLKTGFHAVCYLGTMPRLVRIKAWFSGIIHCKIGRFISTIRFVLFSNKSWDEMSKQNRNIKSGCFSPKIGKKKKNCQNLYQTIKKSVMDHLAIVVGR